MSFHLLVHLLIYMFSFYLKLYLLSRSLQCPRLTVHKHLMASMIIFYTSIVVYLEPYVTNRSIGHDYRSHVSNLCICTLYCIYKYIFDNAISFQLTLMITQSPLFHFIQILGSFNYSFHYKFIFSINENFFFFFIQNK